MTKNFIAALILLIFCSSANSKPNQSSFDEIEFLIAVVTQSECTFNRNGNDYRGSEAIEHIKKKYDYFKDDIKNTKDFIKYAATKSELSGRKYTVTCEGEATDNLDNWLSEQLREFRQ